MNKLFKKINGRLKYYKEIWGLYTYKGIECNIEHRGTHFKIIANSRIELYNRARDYESEKVTIEWIDNYIKNTDTVFDIGANIGIYSLLIAKKYPDSNVIAFEPEAGNYYKLNKNILLNNLKNLVPFPIGISDKTGISKFYVSSTELGSSCHSLDRPYSDGIDFIPRNEQGIALYSIPDFISSYGLEFPNHIKIDVDGFELNIIKGSSQILSDPKLKTIMIEINYSSNGSTVEDLISKANFKEVMRESWDGGNGKVANVLFVKN